MERFEQALQIEIDARGRMHDRVGIARANLARGLAEAGKLEPSVVQYEQAIDIFGATLGKTADVTLQNRASRAVLLTMMGDVSTAEDELRALVETIDPEESSSRRLAMIVRYDLGTLLLEQNRVEEARGFLSAALELAQALYGANSVDLAELHHQLGVVWRRLARTDEAQEAFTRALTIWTTHQPDNPRAAPEYKALAVLAYEQGDDERALELAEHAWDAYGRLDYVHPSVRALSAFLVARILRRLEREPKRQEELARLALADLEGSTDPLHADFLPRIRSFLGEATK